MTGDNVSYLIRHLRHLAARAEGDLTDCELLARFCRRGEETAFALLVQRHGPMVLGVCREILGNPHDAQDASQATFLILARKAGSIRNVDSLSGWLHGVARRVALRARAVAARLFSRRVTQGKRSSNVAPAPGVLTTWIAPPCARTMPCTTASPRNSSR